MNQLVYLVQIALRSGKAASGSRLIPSIQKNQSALVLYSSLIGANQKKKLLDKCASYQVPIYEVDSELFNRISKSANMAFGIEDKALAARIEELLGPAQEGR